MFLNLQWFRLQKIMFIKNQVKACYDISVSSDEYVLPMLDKKNWLSQKKSLGNSSSYFSLPLKVEVQRICKKEIQKVILSMLINSENCLPNLYMIMQIFNQVSKIKPLCCSFCKTSSLILDDLLISYIFYISINKVVYLRNNSPSSIQNLFPNLIINKFSNFAKSRSNLFGNFLLFYKMSVRKNETR